jgi:uncharacterized membrane protein
MLSEISLDLPSVFGLIFQGNLSAVHAPSGEELFRILLRWSHFVAGVLWIGLLYFFNLVNVPLQKELDGPTKKIVVPKLMPNALWYFRWGALVTVFVGLTYYAMYILAGDARNAGASPLGWLGLWLVVVLVFYAVLYFVLHKINNGNVLAAVVAVLSLVFTIVVLMLFNDPQVSNKTLSIGVGGGLGIWMFLNVWGIIWRYQKVIIQATIDGTPPPADLARKAFLASRTNAWLSLPMLFLMGTSHGDWIIFGK